MTESSGSIKKRNVWTSAEIRFFLSLIKEKKILGLMDGKRLRVTDIFKTFIGPMREAGFVRDAGQLIVKYKNLKAEYYKCKRNNNISGNDRSIFEFFDEMDELLADRPISQSLDSSFGYESLNCMPVINLAQSETEMSEFSGTVEVEWLEESSSNLKLKDKPECQVNAGPSTSTSYVEEQKKKKQKKIEKEDALLEYLKTVNETQKQERAEDKEMLQKFMEIQEKIFLSCTEKFLTGLKDILQDKCDESQ